MQKPITQLARAFLEPTNATHRQYEALRAYFVDGLPAVDHGGAACRRLEKKALSHTGEILRRPMVGQSHL